MTRTANLLLTAIAPILWGSTYLVTTEYLPQGYPLTLSVLRGLPVGLLFLFLVRELPSGHWWFRSFVLGALNFSIFWWMLFISAYRLPGGIAATLGATQPLIVIFLARMLLGTQLRFMAIGCAILGLCGISVLVITPKASFDPIGLAAGVAGAISMAFGTVLTRRWQPDVSLLTFTSWQLVAGGVLLLPTALWLEFPLPVLTNINIMGFVYLGLISGGLTSVIWFRGISRLEPSLVSALGFLSPITAVIIGWLALGQNLNLVQIAAIIMVLFSLWLSQFSRSRI